MRHHPLLGLLRLHTGLDFSGPIGEPVRAAAAGAVVKAEFRGQHGNYVEIDHGDGVVTTYSHMHRLAVGASDCVAAGDIIGGIGTTGLTAGPHLHFEMPLDGVPVDPAPRLAPR
jgi:murein DD-endopeptidase MepM/ murein hydrolase activator NlpD